MESRRVPTGDAVGRVAAPPPARTWRLQAGLVGLYMFAFEVVAVLFVIDARPGGPVAAASPVAVGAAVLAAAGTACLAALATRAAGRRGYLDQIVAYDPWKASLSDNAAVAMLAFIAMACPVMVVSILGAAGVLVVPALWGAALHALRTAERRVDPG